MFLQYHAVTAVSQAGLSQVFPETQYASRPSITVASSQEAGERGDRPVGQLLMIELAYKDVVWWVPLHIFHFGQVHMSASIAKRGDDSASPPISLHRVRSRLAATAKNGKSMKASDR